jgi:hypothetical protein
MKGMKKEETLTFLKTRNPKIFRADPKFSLSRKSKKVRLTRKVAMVRFYYFWEQ